MLIGVDFDNTIVCYDRLFHRVCVERGLIPAGTDATKLAVRNYLRAANREEAWTEVQGYVYGARMREAEPFPGVQQFFHRCHRQGVPVRIISHRTRYPFAGERYDLHAAAARWLADAGFHDPAGIGLAREHVHFELTADAKAARVASVACTHFVDDLPEFLAHHAFPASTQRILFDPSGLYPDESRFERASSWAVVDERLQEIATR